MPNPRRLTAPRLAIMMVFAAFGSAVGSLAGSIPTVAHAAELGNVTLGFAMTVSSLATVITMSLGGVVARHASNRTVLLWGLPLLALVMTMLLLSSSAAMFFMAYIGVGLMLGVIDIFMNAEGSAIERDMRAPIFAAFHGCVSAGVMVFAILSSFLSTRYGTWAAALAMSACFAAAWVTVLRCIAGRPLAAGVASRISSLASTTPLVLLGLAAGLIIAAEMAALLWSAKLLDEQAPDLAAIAGLGAAFFGLCNALVRFGGDRLRGRFGDLPLMMGSLAVAIAGFAALGFSQSFAASVAAFAAVGFGTAVLIPCVFALAASLVPANRAGGLGFVSLVAGAPRTVAPWAIGWSASVFGLGAAFGFLAAGLAVALGLIAGLRRMNLDS